MNYSFKSKPTNKQRQLSWILREIGNSPYRAKQPNGWSDFEIDWVSPELLLRRFWFASIELPILVKSGNNDLCKNLVELFDSEDKSIKKEYEKLKVMIS